MIWNDNCFLENLFMRFIDQLSSKGMQINQFRNKSISMVWLYQKLKREIQMTHFLMRYWKFEIEGTTFWGTFWVKDNVCDTLYSCKIQIWPQDTVVTSILSALYILTAKAAAEVLFTCSLLFAKYVYSVHCTVRHLYPKTG